MSRRGWLQHCMMNCMASSYDSQTIFQAAGVAGTWPFTLGKEVSRSAWPCTRRTGRLLATGDCLAKPFSPSIQIGLEFCFRPTTCRFASSISFDDLDQIPLSLTPSRLLSGPTFVSHLAVLPVGVLHLSYRASQKHVRIGSASRPRRRTLHSTTCSTPES